MRHPSVGWMSRTAPSVAAGLLWALGGVALAAAERQPVTLTWDAPAGCPTADEVLADVDRTLAAPGGADTPIVATVRVSPGPDGVWQAALSLGVRGARTERRFRAESCGAIAAATAVILAIAVEDASEPPTHPTGGPAAQAGEKAGSPTEPAGGWTSEVFMTANALVDWDTMPSPPAIGYEAAVGQSFSSSRWRLRWLAGANFFPSHPSPDTPYVGMANGAFWMAGLSGRGCLGMAISRFEVGPCLGAELVAMHATDGGITDPNQISVANQTHFWLSLLGSMEGSWSVSGAMAVMLRVDLAIPTSRSVFGLRDSVVDDYQVPARAVRGALGIQVRFP